MNTDLNIDPRNEVGDSDNPHLLLGAYVLGALSDEDRRAFIVHLGSCLACREELVSLAWLRRCLGQLAPAARAQLAAQFASRREQSP